MPLNRQKSRDEPGSSAKNWWGDDKLPPPSMRQPFTRVRLGTDNENSAGNGNYLILYVNNIVLIVICLQVVREIGIN